MPPGSTHVVWARGQRRSAALEVGLRVQVPKVSAARARDIAEDLLRRTGEALRSGAFEIYADCFHLPYGLETFDGAQVLRTRQDLEQIFNDVRDTLHRLDVDENSRHIVEARFHDPHTIYAVHEVRLVSRGVLIQEAFPVLSVVRPFDGAWKMTHGSYALPDSPDATHHLVGKIVKGNLRR